MEEVIRRNPVYVFKKEDRYFVPSFSDIQIDVACSIERIEYSQEGFSWKIDEKDVVCYRSWKENPITEEMAEKISELYKILSSFSHFKEIHCLEKYINVYFNNRAVSIAFREMTKNPWSEVSYSEINDEFLEKLEIFKKKWMEYLTELPMVLSKFSKRVRGLLVKEKYIDLDKKKIEMEEYATKINVIQCPVCGEWRVRVLERVPVKFLKKEPKIFMVTLRARASPRHAEGIVIREEDMQKGYSAHSDNKYLGWAGDHIEYVWCFFKEEPDIKMVMNFDEEEVNVIAEHNITSYRKELIISDTEMTSIFSMDDDYIFLQPHYSCLAKALMKNSEEYTIQGHLEIRRLKNSDLIKYIDWCDKEKCFKFFNHYIDSAIVSHEYPAGERRVAFVNVPDTATVYASEHESRILERGYYVLAHWRDVD